MHFLQNSQCLDLSGFLTQQSGHILEGSILSFTASFILIFFCITPALLHYTNNDIVINNIYVVIKIKIYIVLLSFQTIYPTAIYVVNITK